MKSINATELEAFKQTLPAEIRGEYFKWLITCYGVAEALFLITRKKIEPRDISVHEWCKALGMAGELNKSDMCFNLLTGVNDNAALHPKINPDIPIIVVEHTWGRGKKKESSTLVIDGNKRLRRAFLDGRNTIKAYYLPEPLAKLCIL